ncbi:MAG TPA: class I SAM-dependent methyltransferase, partial [Alphaproteobacteria bacterium]
MNTEKAIIDHYTSRDMADQILAAARKSAADPACLTVDELAPYDEFHIGRRRATSHFLEFLKLSPGMNVLDIGCGIGGAARVAAVEYDVNVTGLDLTPQFVDTAQILSDAAQLSDKTKFQIGSATEMPFA